MPEYITRSNTNYQISDADIAAGGLVTREYMIDVYPSLAAQFKYAGLWVWGRNSYGQLGDNTRVDKSSPVQTIAGGINWKEISNGTGFMGAIKTDGTLWTWGDNSFGQLGDNQTTISQRSSPVQTVAGGTNWKQISCGVTHMGSVKTDGTLWMWGSNGYGQVGTNSGKVLGYSSPVQTVSGGTNWKQVSCGTSMTSAVKTDGTLWSWGQNQLGGLGDNTTVSKSSPVQTVSGGTNWESVDVGNQRVGAIKTDGTLWLWGYNLLGTLGDNSIVSKSSPVQTIALGTNWKQISCGNGDHAGSIKTDGTLWVWGYNNSGQLGTNDRVHRSSPIQTISGGTNWKQLTIGADSTLSIKTDGTLWVWGNNAGGPGQLGTNDTANRSSPVQTVSGGTNWKQVSNSSNEGAAIRDDSDDPF